MWVIKNIVKEQMAKGSRTLVLLYKTEHTWRNAKMWVERGPQDIGGGKMVFW